MTPTTPEEREDVILQILNHHPNGIGFNQLQKESTVPRKTLYRYLNNMQQEDKINIKKLGEKPNSELRITANFSERSKQVVNHNLEVTTKQHWTRYRTKIQKSNVFPHYLQQLSAEYYQYMIFNLFENSPLYKFALNRLEEHLAKERERLHKEFGGKNLERIYEACEEVAFNLSTNALSSMNIAGMRNLHRTSDEIFLDSVVTPEIHPVEPSCNIEKDLEHDEILEDSRIDMIKDKKKQEEFVELVKEHNELSSKLTNIRVHLANISGMYHFKHAFMTKPTDNTLD